MGELLPRLHEVDSYSLSGWAEGKVTVSKHDGNLQDQNETETGVFLFFEDSDTLNRTAICSLYNFTSFFVGSGTVTDVVKISKRNTQESLTAARQRFLERKRAREKNQGR